MKLLNFNLSEKFPNNYCVLKNGTFLLISKILSDKEILAKKFTQSTNLIKQSIDNNKVNIKIAKNLSTEINTFLIKDIQSKVMVFDIGNSHILMPLLHTSETI